MCVGERSRTEPPNLRPSDRHHHHDDVRGLENTRPPGAESLRWGLSRGSVRSVEGAWVAGIEHQATGLARPADRPPSDYAASPATLEVPLRVERIVTHVSPLTTMVCARPSDQAM